MLFTKNNKRRFICQAKDLASFSSQERCKTCHKRDGYFGKNVQTFSKYNKHCSVKCTNADKELSSARTAKAIQTCLKKYGKTTFLQTSESRQKAVSTFIEKYGKDYLKSFKKF